MKSRKPLQQRQAEMLNRHTMPQPRVAIDPKLVKFIPPIPEPEPQVIAPPKYVSVRENGKFAKGHSGYPGGVWAKGSITQVLKRRAEQGDAETIAQRVLETAKGLNAKARTADELKAAELVIDRLEGKAIQRRETVSVQLSEETANRLASLMERITAAKALQNASD